VRGGARATRGEVECISYLMGAVVAQSRDRLHQNEGNSVHEPNKPCLPSVVLQTRMMSTWGRGAEVAS
jgi:hypothetical protein